MSKFWNIYIGCLLLCLAPEIGGQTYDVIERRNFWNSGSNATGIRMDSITVSYAELRGENGHGDFRNYYEADKLWKAGGEVKSITHTEKYSMAGSFSFTHMSGKNMSGSMFIDPGFYPVDVLEFTPGRKDLQTYTFNGKISVDIAPNWRIGGGIDFMSGNYAKRKDLRHTNYRLDLSVSPGVMYHTENYAIGLSYIFGKNSESIDGNEVGNTATSYYAFLDKGLMYGVYEVWDGSGIHLKTTNSGITRFPVKELIHGVALQAQLNTFYMDLEYRHSSGSVGEKEIIWFKFPSHRITSHIGYRFGDTNYSHFLRFNLNWMRQENNENVLGQETNNGITLVYTYGSNRIFKREMLSVNPEYEFISKDMEFICGAEISSLNRVSTLMFPNVSSQSLICQQIYLTGILHKSNFDFKTGASFSSGNFTDKNRTVSTEIEAGDELYHLTDYYTIQNEYMIASRIHLNVACRWNFRQGFIQGMYAEIGAEYSHGFNLQYIEGANRWFETIKIGYNF